MYVKLINEHEIQYPPKNKGSIINYNLNVDLLIADGYKEFVPAEKDPTKGYIISYTETKTQIIEHAEEIPQPDPAEQREEQFDRDFFNTTFGYIRRNVTMQDGSTKDFLSDLLPAIDSSISKGLTVNVITYDKPEDFSEEITDWTPYQHIKQATQAFIQECYYQLQNDFMPIN